MISQNPIKIFVIGWFGAGNMGDEAILISELLALRKQMKKVEFYILSFHPERTKRITADIPEVSKILRMGSKHNVIKSDLLKILKTFREVDVVIIGGGGIFQDIYNHYPIPFFTSMALLTRLYRKRLVLYCLGLGPVHGIMGKRLCRLAAKCAHLISVRDHESREFLSNFGIGRKVHLSADPVFLLEPVWSENVEGVIENHNLHTNKPIIGVCVQDLLSWGDGNKKILAETLDTLTEEREAKVVFLPLGAYRDGWFSKDASDTVDMAASKRVSGLMKNRYELVDEELLPQELMALMERMDLVISMRLHGLIMGLSRGVPAIALTYRQESKIRNLMGIFGQEINLFDVDRLEKQKLLGRIDALLSEEHESKGRRKRMVSSLRNRAESFNRLLCEELPDIAPQAMRANPYPPSGKSHF